MGQPVGEPQRLEAVGVRTAGKARGPGRPARAVGGEGRRGEAGQPVLPLGSRPPGRRALGGGCRHLQDRDRPPVAGQLLQRGGQALQPLAPARRIGPAAIEQQQERPVAPLGPGVQHRPGKGKDRRRKGHEPEQQEPPGRALRHLLGVPEAEQQPHPGKGHPPRRRRHRPEQPPQDRQQHERAEQPRGEEGDGAERHRRGSRPGAAARRARPWRRGAAGLTPTPPRPCRARGARPAGWRSSGGGSSASRAGGRASRARPGDGRGARHRPCGARARAGS